MFFAGSGVGNDVLDDGGKSIGGFLVYGDGLRLKDVGGHKRIVAVALDGDQLISVVVILPGVLAGVTVPKGIHGDVAVLVIGIGCVLSFDRHRAV